MNIHKIHFHDKIKNNPEIFLHVSFLSYRKNFLGTQKQVRISHGKRAIDVRVIEVLLFIVLYCCVALYCIFCVVTWK